MSTHRKKQPQKHTRRPTALTPSAEHQKLATAFHAIKDPTNANMTADSVNNSSSLIQNYDTNPNAIFTSSTLEATTAVFDTNELLHLIIGAIPRENRTSLRRVSKAWRAAVLKLGHVIEPIGYRFRLDLWRPGAPMYPLLIKLKHNPIVSHRNKGWTTMVMSDVPGSYDMLLNRSPRPKSVAKPGQLDHEFITDPPITQLALCCSAYGQVASLQVREGIRVGHLVEHLAKMHVPSTWGAYGRPKEFWAQ